jgi:hypothetical protein
LRLVRSRGVEETRRSRRRLEVAVGQTRRAVVVVAAAAAVAAATAAETEAQAEATAAGEAIEGVVKEAVKGVGKEVGVTEEAAVMEAAVTGPAVMAPLGRARAARRPPQTQSWNRVTVTGRPAQCKSCTRQHWPWSR